MSYELLVKKLLTLNSQLSTQNSKFSVSFELQPNGGKVFEFV
jgi:hypothetical protein